MPGFSDRSNKRIAKTVRDFARQKKGGGPLPVTAPRIISKGVELLVGKAKVFSGDYPDLETWSATAQDSPSDLQRQFKLLKGTWNYLTIDNTQQDFFTESDPEEEDNYITVFNKGRHWIPENELVTYWKVNGKWQCYYEAPYMMIGTLDTALGGASPLVPPVYTTATILTGNLFYGSKVRVYSDMIADAKDFAENTPVMISWLPGLPHDAGYVWEPRFFVIQAAECPV